MEMNRRQGLANMLAGRSMPQAQGGQGMPQLGAPPSYPRPHMGGGDVGDPGKPASPGQPGQPGQPSFMDRAKSFFANNAQDQRDPTTGERIGGPAPLPGPPMNIVPPGSNEPPHPMMAAPMPSPRPDMPSPLDHAQWPAGPVGAPMTQQAAVPHPELSGQGMGAPQPQQAPPPSFGDRFAAASPNPTPGLGLPPPGANQPPPGAFSQAAFNSPQQTQPPMPVQSAPATPAPPLGTPTPAAVPGSIPANSPAWAQISGLSPDQQASINRNLGINAAAPGAVPATPNSTPGIGSPPAQSPTQNLAPPPPPVSQPQQQAQIQPSPVQQGPAPVGPQPATGQGSGATGLFATPQVQQFAQNVAQQAPTFASMLSSIPVGTGGLFGGIVDKLRQNASPGSVPSPLG